MQVLLTNDDGIDAAGLLTLRAHLIRHFDSVITVAPIANCSGFARKCTYHTQVRIERTVQGEHAMYSCDGTPTDCVRAGLIGGLAADAQLVVSGINHGANLADDVTNSGTIGAGLEASILGVSSLCVSQQIPSGSMAVNSHGERNMQSRDFEFAARQSATVAASLTHSTLDAQTILSLNFPNVVSENVIRITQPGRRAYPNIPAKPWTDEGEAQNMYLYGQANEVIPELSTVNETDIIAIQAGHISITPLTLGLGFGEANNANEMRGKLEEILSSALPDFQIVTANQRQSASKVAL
ncbi:MAG: 5'/3'-nucleotidase SurE [Actinobacteria bacterium]|nr:5'/3'-nucleotidase SurE [Actinomycetota bacterium]